MLPATATVLAGALDQLPGQRGHGGLAVGAGDGQHARARSPARRCSLEPGLRVNSVELAADRRTRARRDRGRSDTAPTCAGDRPGLRNTRLRLRRAAIRRTRPPTKRASGSSSRSAASRGGCSRVSATVTRRAARAHQRAIARPESPRPRTSTALGKAGSGGGAAGSRPAAPRPGRSGSHAPARHRQAGRAEAQDSDGRCRAGAIGYLSFKVDRPTRHSSMVMIQKRTTTCVSVQPLFSKWWCSGAILRMRRPSP